LKNAFFHIIAGFSVFFLFFCTVNSAEKGGKVVTPKKGVAAAQWGPDRLAEAGASWYYNWRSRPNNGDAPAGQEVEYVPMISRAGDANDDNFQRLTEAQQNGEYTHLLGFNEPDIGGQANMSVDAVIAEWPRLEATGLRLGSPAPSWLNDWIAEFMQKAEQQDLRVDFLCLHFYRAPTAEGVVQELEDFLQRAYIDYGKPIWVTEFGAPDCNSLGWCGNADPLNQSSVDAYIEDVIAMLEGLPFVERYSWFVDRAQDGFEYSAIFDDNGNLTPTGIAFRDAQGASALNKHNPGNASAGLPFTRLCDGSLLFRFPGPEAGYRVTIHNTAGTRLFSYRGTGPGNMAINPAAEGLGEGFYFARVEQQGAVQRAGFIIP
jgi:hypothetical protein